MIVVAAVDAEGNVSARLVAERDAANVHVQLVESGLYRLVHSATVFLTTNVEAAVAANGTPVFAPRTKS